MIKFVAPAALAFLLLLGPAGGFLRPGVGQAVAEIAREKTITLSVKNMVCELCPYTVKKSLEAVPGVAKAVVSLKDKTAVVTYDESKATVAALIKATTNAGFPSALKN